MHNQRTLVDLALDAGAACEVAGPAALTGALVKLLSDGDARAAMRAAAARLLAENRGASARCAAVVAELVRP
jgi:3-deoxy-D-manno-octulosonic-acid transferase